MPEIREKVKPKCEADWKDYQVREGGREGCSKGKASGGSQSLKQEKRLTCAAAAAASAATP